MNYQVIKICVCARECDCVSADTESSILFVFVSHRKSNMKWSICCCCCGRSETILIANSYRLISNLINNPFHNYRLPRAVAAAASCYSRVSTENGIIIINAQVKEWEWRKEMCVIYHNHRHVNGHIINFILYFHTQRRVFNWWLFNITREKIHLFIFFLVVMNLIKLQCNYYAKLQ
jgi:hypothetical protein